jgi:hypothetical protein
MILELKKLVIEEAIKKRLEAILIDINNHKCLVGIPAGKTNIKAEKKYKIEQELEIATYAAQNEFGSFSKHIPSRPFLRTTFTGEKMKLIVEKAKGFLTQCAEQNRNAKDFLEKIGLFAAGQVRKNITDGAFTPNPPNASLTIAIKKSSHTLIDTGEMRRAVTSWVTKK